MRGGGDIVVRGNQCLAYGLDLRVLNWGGDVEGHCRHRVRVNLGETARYVVGKIMWLYLSPLRVVAA